jgi:hypothetical protein
MIDVSSEFSLAPKAWLHYGHISRFRPDIRGQMRVNTVKLEGTEHVCFGSTAASQHHISRAAAFGQK